MNSEKIDAKGSPGLIKEIKRLAKLEGRTFSGQVRYMLEQYLKTNKK